MLKINENYFFIDPIFTADSDVCYYVIHYGKLVNLIPKYDMKLAAAVSKDFGGRDSYAIFECEYDQDKTYKIRANSSESLKYFNTLDECSKYCLGPLGLKPQEIWFGLSVMWYL